MQTIHATTVVLGDAGVLLRGPSGSGKSDLALQLIDRGGVLVADDRTALQAVGGLLIASVPATIAGRMEVRGLGVLRVRFQPQASVRLVVDLLPADAATPVERMPEPATADLCGIRLRRICLRAFESSAAAKIRLAVGLNPTDME